MTTPWGKAPPVVAPPPDLQPPPPVRVLQVTKSPRERLRWYGYTAGFGAGVLAWPLLWWKLAGAGLSWEYVTCFGAGGWLLLWGGFGLFALQQGKEIANTRLYYQVAAQEVAWRGHALGVLADRAVAHSARHYGPPPVVVPPPPVPIHNWQDWGKARVQDAPMPAATEAPDPVTRRLPELPAPSAYWGSDVQVLVDAITSGADASARKGPLSPERHKAAMAWLVSEGFMAKRIGRGFVPTDRWGTMPAAQWHDAIIRLWGAG